MNVLFLILLLTSFAALILGMYKPISAIRWGKEEKRNRINVLKYYGTGVIVFFILFCVTVEKKEVPTSSTNETATISNKTVEIKTKAKYIIGSTKEQVKELLLDYSIDEEYTKNVDSNSIKFENKNIMIGVDFDKNGIAEGVYIQSMNLSGMDIVTQKGAYVSLHYDELVKLSKGERTDIIVKDDLNSEYNQTGANKYPAQLFIGNLHE